MWERVSNRATSSELSTTSLRSALPLASIPGGLDTKPTAPCALRSPEFYYWICSGIRGPGCASFEEHAHDIDISGARLREDLNSLLYALRNTEDVIREKVFMS